MWPFSRKKKSIDDLPAISDPGQQWGVAEGICGGAPILVRFSTTAREWVAHRDLPIKLGFAVPLNNPDEGGLPDLDENEQLDRIEDIVRSQVEARAKGMHVLSLTTGTMKEFVFYIAAGADIKTMHETVQAQVPAHEVQCMAVGEPDWDSYREFVPD